jgi:hypothetical protein
MSDQVCLRCDWTGEAGTSTCPECGTGLFRMPPPEQKPKPERTAQPRRPRTVAPPPPADDVFVPVIDRSLPEPERARRRVRRVAIAVAAIAATAIATLQLRSPATPAAAHGPLPGVQGSLVYSARDRDGWVLWSWDLSTGVASKGPHVDRPVELVSASGASPGWIGLTSAEGRRRTASVVHSVTPDSRATPIATGDLVSWSAAGEELTSLRFGPRRHGCMRHVEIRSWVVAFGTDEIRFDDPMCGLPLSIARGGTFDYLVEANGTTASIRIIGADYTERFMQDHVLVGLSDRGDFLVTPVPRPGEVPGDVPPPGLQFFHRRPPKSGPMAFGTEGQPLLSLAFLSWSWDANEAYILGSYGGVRGVYRVTLGPGVNLRVPELVHETDAETVDATVTNVGDLFLLLDDRLTYEHGEEVEALQLPAGAPEPAGPMLWVPPGGAASGLG